MAKNYGVYDKYDDYRPIGVFIESAESFVSLAWLRKVGVSWEITLYRNGRWGDFIFETDSENFQEELARYLAQADDKVIADQEVLGNGYTPIETIEGVFDMMKVYEL